MVHALVYTGEDEQNARFTCARCNCTINFNKPGVGQPCAIADGEAWQHPDCPDQWMTACEAAE